MIIRYGLPVLALLTLGGAIYSTRRMTPVRAEADPPATPPQSAYGRQVGAVGLVEAASENVAISVPVPGLVVKVLVKAGDRVRRGQPLFALDDRDLRAELALRESNLALAESRLARLEAAPRPEELPPAEARVAEARAQWEDARTQLRLIESVKDRRAIREEDLEKRRRAVDIAQARIAESEAALKLLRAGTWKADLAVARTEVAQAAQQVERIRADLSRLTIAAPMDGQVLQLKVRAGEYAPAGQLTQPLLLLGAVDRLHVRTDVDERDAWRVKAGAAAQASVRGNAGQRYPLEFVRVEPYVVPKRNLTNEATERVDSRVLQIIYALPADAPVYPGQQMDVSIADGGAR